MAELLHLTQPWAFSYVNNFGKEIHGNGRFNSKLEALEALCRNANIKITDEIKEQFGVGSFDEALSAELDRIKDELSRLKVMQVKTYDLANEKQETVVEKTPSKPKAKKTTKK